MSWTEQNLSFFHNKIFEQFQTKIKGLKRGEHQETWKFPCYLKTNQLDKTVYQGEDGCLFHLKEENNCN